MNRHEFFSSLIKEEKRASIVFLFLFYFTVWGYDIYNYYVLNIFVYDGPIGVPTEGLGYAPYVIHAALLPVAIYLLRNNRPEKIKYIYFFTFILITLVNEIITINSGVSQQSSNLFELVIVIFTPMFVNVRFFYIVSLTTILKYLIVGLLARDPEYIIPAALIIAVSFIGYIILKQFKSYIDTMSLAFDKQIQGIVKGVVSSLELKDPYTRGHSERVAAYSRIMAEKIGGFSREELRYYNYACLLHDVGKIRIPDSILMKPSKLTGDEYDIIKTHPEEGVRAMKDIEGLEGYLNVILSHHERWDGKGYPEGLTKKETPLPARITSVADAFDAMTTSRSYRSALTTEEAKKRIIAGKGTQLIQI